MTQTLVERDGALVHNWYIACLSSELNKKKPLRRVLYGTPYVLFRDENGKPVCLPDRCLHRAAQLSLGECENGKIKCPYHGWAYDKNGVVTEVPSEGPGPREGKQTLCLPPLPTAEQDGSIWVWMGKGEKSTPMTATPPWRFPHYDDKNWVHYFMVTDFENEVTNLVENFMDVPHTVFVHKHWFRNQAFKKVPMTLEIKDAQVLVTYHQTSDSIGMTGLLINPKRQPMIHTDHYIYPNITRVDYNFGDYSNFIINSQCTPVDTMQSRVYTYIAFRIGVLTRFAGAILGPLMHKYTRVVINQDVDIMKNQSTNLKLNSSTDYKSTEADEVHVAIERIREMGIKGDPGLYQLKRTREKSFWI